MGKKRRTSVSISLFSFQDIITCLSGIMILLVLLITLDMVTQKLSARPDADIKYEGSPFVEDQNRLEKDRLEKNVKELENRHQDIQDQKKQFEIIERGLHSRLEELKKLHDALFLDNTITLIPEKGSEQKPLLVECSGDTIRRGKTNLKIDTGVKINPDVFSTDGIGIQQFLKSLALVNKKDEYILFMIKPSASDYAMQLIGQVRRMGFDVGYDAMLEDQVLSFGSRD